MILDCDPVKKKKKKTLLFDLYASPNKCWMHLYINLAFDYTGPPSNGLEK